MPYFKLATWDARAMTFRDGKRGYDTEAAARAAATAPGRYRISTVTDAGRTDGEPFEVAGKPKAAKRPGFQAGGLTKRPTPRTRS